jgi:pimeloyl-ACP methyl ester carboxylesterase
MFLSILKPLGKAEDRETTEATASTNGGGPTVILVHGGFVDGSGWQASRGLVKAKEVGDTRACLCEMRLTDRTERRRR